MSNLNKLKNIDASISKIKKYDRYLPTAFDESLTIIEKINKIIQVVYRYSDITEEMLLKWNEVYHWLRNEGLNESIVDRLNEWLGDGTLARIINEVVLSELNDKIKEMEEKIDKSYEEYEKLKNELLDVINTINEDVNKAINSSKFLKTSNITYLSPLFKADLYDNSNSINRHPQGFTIDSENELYYISRQEAGYNKRIYEYNFDNELIRYKEYNNNDSVYLEGLVHFISNGDVKFILPMKATGKYCIFNFETGTIENEININGTFHVSKDNNNKYFITGSASKYPSTTGDVHKNWDGFLLYDLSSVINGSPILKHKINVDNKVLMSPKTQGFTMIDDMIYLGKGKEITSVASVDLNGNLIDLYTPKNSGLSDVLNISINENQNVENEGIHWIKENNVTYIVNSFCIKGTINKIFLVKMGDIRSGKKVSSVVNDEANTYHYNLFDYNGSYGLGFGANIDFYKEVKNYNKTGMWTFFIDGKAKNTIPTETSLRGILVVTTVNAKGNATYGYVYGTDYNGTMWSNFLDNGTWIGWSQIGGKSAYFTENKNPLLLYSGKVETKSNINAPVKSDAFKMYTITPLDGGKNKAITCQYSSRKEFYIGYLNNSGNMTAWKKVLTEDI